MSDTDWTPDHIKRLRSARGQTQAAFGLDLCDVDEDSAQTIVSRLERGKVQPSACMRRTFQRMESGEI
jgi:transcriptional regulator with XRE-family HTH domain